MLHSCCLVTFVELGKWTFFEDMVQNMAISQPEFVIWGGLT